MPRYVDLDNPKIIRGERDKFGLVIYHIPPDTPCLNLAERKKGKWIRITQGTTPEQYICPFCHRTIETYCIEELLSIRYPYCHCGADMRTKETDCDYERAVEQLEHDMLYEPTFNQDDGSM